MSIPASSRAFLMLVETGRYREARRRADARVRVAAREPQPLGRHFVEIRRTVAPAAVALEIRVPRPSARMNMKLGRVDPFCSASIAISKFLLDSQFVVQRLRFLSHPHRRAKFHTVSVSILLPRLRLSPFAMNISSTKSSVLASVMVTSTWVWRSFAVRTFWGSCRPGLPAFACARLTRNYGTLRPPSITCVVPVMNRLSSLASHSTS